MPAGIYRGRVLFFYKAFNCGHYQSAGFIRGRVLFEEIRQTLDTVQEILYQQSRHKLNKLKYFATVHKISRSLSIIGEGTFYEWFKSIFTMRDEDIEDSYGEDALQYLRFQRYVIGYLMFVMVICISVVLPLNFMGGLQGKI